MAYRMDTCPLLLGVCEVLSHRDDGLDPPPPGRALPPEPPSHLSTYFRASIVSPEKDRRQWDTGLRLPRSPGGPSPVGPGGQTLAGRRIQGIGWAVLGDTADGEEEG